MKCNIESCDSPAIARSLCRRHYAQYKRGHIAADVLPKKTPIERLLEKIDQRGRDECWPWKGAIGTWGYGVFWIDGVNINASRAAYILLVGPVSGDRVVCHSCDNPACCNPKHLWAGTQQENLDDCRKKGRARTPLSSNGYAGHPRYGAKLTPELVIEARRLYFVEGVSQSEIGRRWRIHSSVISRAVRGENWRHV